MGVGGRDLGFGGLRRGKVCRAGTDGCSNSLSDCQLFGRGLTTIVGEASFDLCGDRHELGVDGLDMVVGGLHQRYGVRNGQLRCRSRQLLSLRQMMLPLPEKQHRPFGLPWPPGRRLRRTHAPC